MLTFSHIHEDQPWGLSSFVNSPSYIWIRGRVLSSCTLVKVVRTKQKWSLHRQGWEAAGRPGGGGVRVGFVLF